MEGRVDGRMARSLPSGSEWRQGVLDAAPIAMSVLLFGAIYGMLSLQAGLTAWESLAMSLIVYAGAAQFAALSMLSGDAGFWAIVLATFFINSRHFLIGLSMSPYYKSFSGRFTSGMAFFLIDESYAIMLNRFREHAPNKGYIAAVGLMLYGCWNVGTVLGTAAGKWIPDPQALGLGMSFTLMFLALAYYQLYSWLRILTFVVCGALAVWLAGVLPNGLHLLAAGVAAFAVGYLLPERSNEQSKAQAGDASDLSGEKEASGDER
ncbi:AzlC family ABC transporter permease [Tumebacillus sp. DT12]|uniref:AzlC family ABC transporter permease n=1 Tax=Tumebacillus lacus TaxID=2995335 RepID=A0ABT3X7Y8_9BACL|nr:AzlC family ABC transporter permease [Tumebacillus lacus]MCX7571720.1 AzlC family ABC transporter permease [Tumebacillus lacus]